MRTLRTPTIGRIQLGGVAICALYLGLLLFAALYKSSVFKDPKRAGWVAISQIPVVYVLATKNNVLSVAWGTAYDRLNYVHRFAGRLLVLAGNVHAIGYIYRFTMQNRWTRIIAQPPFAWGLVSLILLDILFLFSLAWLRQKFYNLFISTHFVASIAFLVTICLHMPAAIPYVIVGAVFYGLDRALRILKTRIVTATVTTMPEMYTTQLAIPQINAGWRAGQFVRIRVLSGGTGLRGWLVSHPFTIACGGVGEGGAPYGLTLLIKNSGRWTKRLYDISTAKQRGLDAGNHVRVLIEGPYGGSGYTLPHSFFGALYVVGGSGISYAGTSTLRVIDLVWSVRHPDCLTPLLPTFSSLLAQAAAANVKLEISVFYTRAVTLDHEFKDYVLPMDLRLEPGHRRLQNMVRDVVDRTLRTIQNGEDRRGVFIGTCGPAALSDPIRDVIGDLDSEGLSSMVGGVELHEEIFALD
ncbi:iron reductase [Ganoderma leucocontextum]|nr:iron reductase [Ganoderma leucocontextum]